MQYEVMCDTVRYGLDSGFSTNEIASDVGCEYESILEAFRRHKETSLRARMIRLRKKEWEARMFGRKSYNVRCPHGFWSTDGKCNGHVRNGRKPGKVAA